MTLPPKNWIEHYDLDHRYDQTCEFCIDESNQSESYTTPKTAGDVQRNIRE